MSADYDNDTWEYYPSKCRAPACRCESPCDDMGGTHVCVQCGRNADYCTCKRNDACGCFVQNCDHCADCGELREDCDCQQESLAEARESQDEMRRELRDEVFDRR